MTVDTIASKIEGDFRAVSIRLQAETGFSVSMYVGKTDLTFRVFRTQVNHDRALSG
jgi:hypothetical protein